MTSANSWSPEPRDRWQWTAPRPHGALGWTGYAAAALAIAWVLHWSAGGAQMSWGELAAGMPQIADFVARSVPPDWSMLPRLMAPALETVQDRKSTRLNSSHLVISYAVFCLKKKNATP